LGGVLAAIPAAWMVRHINERTLGIAVGALILLLSLDSVLSLVQPPEQIVLLFRVVAVVVTIALLALAVRRARAESLSDDRADNEALATDTGHEPGRAKSTVRSET
jgi:hypothetical protein